MEEEIKQPGQNNSKNSMLMVLAIVLVIIVGGFFWYRSQQVTKVSNVQKQQTTNGASITKTEKKFTVNGGSFYFTPNKITVNKGDLVTILFRNDDGMHNFVIDEFAVTTKVIKTEESDSVSFAADKTGNFEFYCSVGLHRSMGMKGTLIVQ